MQFPAKRRLRRWLLDRGYLVRRLVPGEIDDVARLAHCARQQKVSVFIDVGANRGQFATDLRLAGYGGRIISFEPLTAAHAALAQAAGRDPRWTVASPMALGARTGRDLINVSANSYSSSLLPMTERLLSHPNPGLSYIERTEVPVRRLDDVLPSLAVDAGDALGLKIDVQGYEGEVLAGAQSTLDRVALLFVELSLVPLYVGALPFDEVCATLRKHGFKCIALSPEFSDPSNGEMLQVNGTFIKAIAEKCTSAVAPSERMDR